MLPYTLTASTPHSGVPSLVHVLSVCRVPDLGVPPVLSGFLVLNVNSEQTRIFRREHRFGRGFPFSPLSDFMCSLRPSTLLGSD